MLGDGGVGPFDFACLWRAQILLSRAGMWSDPPPTLQCSALGPGIMWVQFALIGSILWMRKLGLGMDLRLMQITQLGNGRPDNKSSETH